MTNIAGIINRASSIVVNFGWLRDSPKPHEIIPSPIKIRPRSCAASAATTSAAPTAIRTFHHNDKSNPFSQSKVTLPALLYGRQSKSSRLVAFGLGLATAANIAAIAAAKADIRITADPGGSLAVYRAKVEALRYSGEKVVVDGRCNSACTLYLTLPASQLCVARRAIFGFHAAINFDTGLPNPRETDALWHSYPPKVQIAVGRRGGLWIKTIYVPGREVARACR